jgi:hypothetical protein
VIRGNINETEECAEKVLYRQVTPEHELLLMYQRPQTQREMDSNKTKDDNDSIEAPYLS